MFYCAAYRTWFPRLKLACQKTSLLIQKNSPHRLIFLALCVISDSILLVCLSCFLRQFFLCFYTFKKIFRFLYFNAKYFQFLIFPFPDSNFLISVGQLLWLSPPVCFLLLHFLQIFSGFAVCGLRCGQILLAGLYTFFCFLDLLKELHFFIHALINSGVRLKLLLCRFFHRLRCLNDRLWLFF